MRVFLIAIAALAACGGKRGGGGDARSADSPPTVVEDKDAGQPYVCHFPSGRPCVEGDICIGMQGNECNYVFCDPRTGGVFGTAVGCGRGKFDTTPAGPFDCDPALVQYEAYRPPMPCPLGGLYTIQNGGWGTCVAVSNCKPLPCNPAYKGDGCPSDYVCDATSSTCVPAS
jgi:hypothetical protein